MLPHSITQSQSVNYSKIYLYWGKISQDREMNIMAADAMVPDIAKSSKSMR